jgi:dTDP-4-amino-4,6-dideoxygalactose transaminase
LGYYKNKYGINPTSYPHASKSEDLSITLPIFPGMTDLDQQKIVNILKAALST